MQNFSFSIVTPVYNAEKYLPRVLESLIRQTYKNFEIILVNDASPGDCAAVCQAYAPHFSHLSCVSHSSNKGLLQAWLTGASHASADYVHFLDADDTVIPETYEILNREINLSKVDVLGFRARHVLHDGSIHSLKSSEEWRPYLQGEEIVKELFEKKCNWNVWNKIYSKKLIHEVVSLFKELDVPKIEYGNDIPLFYCLCLLAKTYRSIPQYLYYYAPPSTSMSTGSFHNRWPQIIQSYEHRKKLLTQIAEKLNVDLAGKEKLERWITQILSVAVWSILQEEDKENQPRLMHSLCRNADISHLIEYYPSIPLNFYSLLCKSLTLKNND